MLWRSTRSSSSTTHKVAGDKARQGCNGPVVEEEQGPVAQLRGRRAEAGGLRLRVRVRVRGRGRPRAGEEAEAVQEGGGGARRARARRRARGGRVRAAAARALRQQAARARRLQPGHVRAAPPPARGPQEAVAPPQERREARHEERPAAAQRDLRAQELQRLRLPRGAEAVRPLHVGVARAKGPERQVPRAERAHHGRAAPHGQLRPGHARAALLRRRLRRAAALVRGARPPRRDLRHAPGPPQVQALLRPRHGVLHRRRQGLGAPLPDRRRRRRRRGRGRRSPARRMFVFATSKQAG